MRDLCLQSCAFHNRSDGIKNSNRARSHGSAAFVTVRPDSAEKVILVLNALQELEETASVSFAGVAFEALYEMTREQSAAPALAREDRLGYRDAHLSIISIFSGFGAVPRLTNVAGQIVVQSDNPLRRIFKSRSVSVS